MNVWQPREWNVMYKWVQFFKINKYTTKIWKTHEKQLNGRILYVLIKRSVDYGNVMMYILFLQLLFLSYEENVTWVQALTEM
jgi:hypothetical protein